MSFFEKPFANKMFIDIKTLLLLPVFILMAVIVASPVAAFDQPWNGGKEDITGPTPPPPPPCPSGNCLCPPNGTRSPVYIADGSLVWSDVDIAFPSSTRVGLKRTYNSFDYRAGLFGRGWVTAQESNIARTYKAITEGNADGSPKTATEFKSVPIWLAAYGRRYTLEETTTQCTTPDVLYFTFEKQADGSFKQVYEDSQSFDIYSATGVLQESYSDEDGTSVYYEYDDQGRLVKQYDSYSFMLNFVYNEQGFVSQVIDQADRVWNYSYNEYGSLTQVVDPDGSNRDYGYQLVDNIGYKQHLLTDVDDNTDDPVLKVTWASRTIGAAALMRVASYTESDGHRHDYSYSATTFNGVAAIKVVKDTKQVGSNATIETQTFIADAGNYQVLSDVNNTDNLNKSSRFDERGNLVEETDERGNVTLFEYNLEGRRIKTTELAGTNDAREITVSYWNNTNRVAVVSEYGNLETRYTYDSDLRVLTQTQVDLGDNQQRVWAYTYHSNFTDNRGNTVLGKVASIDGPQPGAQDTQTFEYNSRGLLTRINYPLIQSMAYSYNAVGQQITETDINGVITEMTYDSRNRLIQVIRNSRIIQYAYNRQGQIKQLTDELGRKTSFAYNDQNQPTRVTYPSGNYTILNYAYLPSYTEVTELYYEENGALISTNIKRNNTNSGLPEFGYLESTTKQIYQDKYNEFDDITQIILYGQFGNGSGITTSVSDYSYDNRGRLIQIRDALNGNASFTYDANDRLAQATDPNSSVTQYEYNAWGDLTKLISPDTGATSYEYDSSGNRVGKIDANNVQTNYVYDAQNRFVKIDYEGESLDTLFTYDENQYGKGLLTSVIDGSGSSQYTYDDRGLMTQSASNIAGTSLTTNYNYDESGQLNQIDYPGGSVVSYSYDSAGRLSGIQRLESGVTTNLLNNITWHGIKTASYQQGNGLKTEFVYDAAERLIEKRFGGSDNRLQNQLDNQGQIIQQTWSRDATQNVDSFKYDSLGRLALDGSTVDNLDLTFSYDAVGNRLIQQKSDNSETISYSYLANTNLLSQVNSATIQRDAVGNTLDDGFRQYQYNVMNRLQQLNNSLSNIQAIYTYNYQGQRVRKHLSGSQNTDIRYVYGPNSELLGEYDSSGNRIKEYIYYVEGEVSQLVAQIQSDGTVIYIHTDHLATPRLATNQNQSIVWRWASDAFGNSMPNEDPDNDSNSVVINHRFQGQQYDLESGLFYNHFRYYDPAIGRYITSDPIGLESGMNTYTYVHQNPLRFSDPNGLAVPVVIAACAANPVCAAAAAAAARAAAIAAARALAKAAAAAAAAACAAGLGPCGKDPGNCSRSRHRYLQNVVDNLCKPNPGNCKPGEKCSSMTDKLAKHSACADARRNINRECFNGGDRGHQIEYTNRRQQAAVCNGLLSTCCP